MLLNPEYIVRVENAHIYQQQKPILKNVNFEIKKGEFAYLIGRTGSGKSSLLKTLYVDLPLKEGQAEVAGFALQQIKRKEIPFLRRRIGIVFQDFQLFYDRSIAENLFFVMRATGWTDRQKMKNRLDEVLSQVGLSRIGFKMPHQLSGGEQQRVVIARALINEPMILFADEPTGNLDPEVSEEILELFLKINRYGTAILMATHDKHLLEKYPARTLVCKHEQVMSKEMVN